MTSATEPFSFDHLTEALPDLFDHMAWLLPNGERLPAGRQEHRDERYFPVAWQDQQYGVLVVAPPSQCELTDAECAQLATYCGWLLTAGQNAAFLATRRAEISPEQIAFVHSLRPGERRIVQQMILGLTPKEIAAKLGIAVGTVRFQQQQIYRHLQVTTAQGAVLVAIRAGLTGE